MNPDDDADRIDRIALRIVQASGRPAARAPVARPGSRCVRPGRACAAHARPRASRRGHRRARLRRGRRLAAVLPAVAACRAGCARAVVAGFGQSPGPGVRVRQGFAAAQQSGQGGGEHLAERRMRVAREPAQRIEQLAVEHRAVVEPGERGAQLRSRCRGRVDGDHDPDQFARSERHRARDDRSHRPWLWRRRAARSRTAAAMAAEGRRARRYRRPEASNQSSDGPARTARLQLASSCSMPSPRLPCNCRADKGFCPYPHELWIRLCILLLRKRP